MYEFRADKVNKALIPILPTASTVSGMISSTDIGKLIVSSSEKGALAIGTTADSFKIIGILEGFQGGVSATTAGSSVPMFVAPIGRGEEINAVFSTSFSTALPASSDVGKYVGFSNTTTVAGAKYLDMATIGNVAGSTSGRFFKITSASSDDVARRILRGVINSSHLAL